MIAEARDLERVLEGLNALYVGEEQSATPRVENFARAVHRSGGAPGRSDLRAEGSRGGLPSRGVWSRSVGECTASAEFVSGAAVWRVVAHGVTPRVCARGVAETMGEAKRVAEVALRRCAD
jgi:hypothetical protein